MKPDAGCWRVPLLIDGRKRLAPVVVALTGPLAVDKALHVAEGMAGTAELWGEPELVHEPGWHRAADQEFSLIMRRLHEMGVP